MVFTYYQLGTSFVAAAEGMSGMCAKSLSDAYTKLMLSCAIPSKQSPVQSQ